MNFEMKITTTELADKRVDSNLTSLDVSPKASVKKKLQKVEQLKAQYLTKKSASKSPKAKHISE